MNLSRLKHRATTLTNGDDCPHTDAIAPCGDAGESARDNRETDQVWEETGVTPPLRYSTAVELLHRLEMGDYSSVILLARSLARLSCENTLYQITSPVRLMRAARDFGIRTAGKTNEEIARDVADAVIDEYVTARHSSLVPE